MISLFSACSLAGAEYVIVYDTDDLPEGAIVNNDGADGTLTFWELPLYFKLISVLCFLSFSSLGILKLLPLLLGKIRLKKGEDNRQRILSYISDNPGCSESDILNDLGMKRGNLQVSCRKTHTGKYAGHCEEWGIQLLFPSCLFNGR